MTFDDLLAQILTLLQQQGRVSYGALKRRFGLDDAYLDDLKAELIDARRLAVDEDGRILVWTGTTDAPPVLPSVSPPSPARRDVPFPPGPVPPEVLAPPEAERRQLTVLVCDLVGSTALAGQLDPEDLLAVLQAYQATCTEVIQRFGGQVAQHLGDGLLVYFGYPRAHDDDAQRAVRAGLGIIEAMDTLNSTLARERGVRLALRVGIHTGLVVVGTMGGAGRQAQLALGDTPLIAARLQNLATPDTVVLSETTTRLVQGYFTWQPLGSHALAEGAQPLAVYQVLGVSGAYSRLDVAPPHALTPLVGREQEVRLLLERWARVHEGVGQVVLVSGEAGIGKSRLVQVVKARLADTLHTRWECYGAPYYQHTAFYPLIDLWERLLHVQRDESPAAKLAKLEDALAQYSLALEETVPLFAALLSLPLPTERYPPLTLTPQRQRQKTLETLLALTLECAARHPVVLIMEDLHWVDPSTLEFLTLLVEQSPTAALFTLLTCRPEFQPPWGVRTHLMPLVLHRLPAVQTGEMVAQVTGGKPLPPEVTQQIVARTDGVPLFVEELTKTVLETGMLQEQPEHYALRGPLPPLAIPATLHDSLMARLDRLAAVKVVAQLGATLGRTFAYDLLQTVAPLEETALQHGLRQLVGAELLYQRGVPPQATYHFKHALIQETAYQSLLKSTRQQYHQRIAQTLEAQFPETVETQPEVLAHHYTEAGLRAQAIPYWQTAGQRALQRSAHLEAISHFTQGLNLLTALSDTPQRAQQELTLRLAIGTPLIATRGYAVPVVEQTYRRALELCQHIGETPQLLPALAGLFIFYLGRGEMYTAQQLSARFLQLAQAAHDPVLSMEAHTGQGVVAYYLGDFVSALEHCEHGLALATSLPHRSRAVLYQDPQLACLIHAAYALWLLGYPEQALRRTHEALAIAQQLSHPYNLVWTLDLIGRFHQLCREEPHLTQERAETTMAAAAEHGFPLMRACGVTLRGWTIVAQGQCEEGLTQMLQGWVAWRTIGSGMWSSYWLGLLAEAYAHGGQREEALARLMEALAAVEDTGQRFYAAELYRLKGELQLRYATPDEQQAEACFGQALEIARQQQAKSLELRAAMSQARLWKRQGQGAKARQLLGEMYGWFTEGFDTADLQEARVLLETLG
jgi:predicted ATPase/class 3 adenylate cyclase